MNKNIELLAPAGDADSFKAAVLAGADAIYFGLERFSARTRAVNLSLDQLETLAPIAKSRGIRLYLTLNTLLRDCEISDALNLTAAALERDVDAIIVQDAGLMAAIRAQFPEAELHASTQMTTHNLAQLEFLARLGVSQINLSRELSIEQILLFSEKLKQYGIIPEVFVHGAYCISYSGQCYLSGALYGQAGNRGACVQPCRRQFSAKSGGFTAPFSLKDNCAFQYAKELCGCAPVSLKIEGRIKSAEYVWTVTKAWREQLALVEAGREASKESELLNKAFNRGFATDYLEGCPTADFFNFGEKDATWQQAGTVQFFSADKKLLKIIGALEKGDKLLIKGRNDKFICNAEVCKIVDEAKTAEAAVCNAQIEITGKLNGKIEKGQTVYKTSPVFETQNLKQQIDSLKAIDIPLSVEISGRLGEPLVCTFSAKNASVTEKTAAVLEKASKHGLDEETLRQKLGRLGGTGFALAGIDAANLEAGLFIAPQELNELRRTAVQKLKDKLEPHKIFKAEIAETAAQESTTISSGGKISKPKLAFFCSSISQAAALVQAEKTAVLEIPLFITEETQKFLAENAAVIPHFQSILFEEDFKSAAACLEKLSDTAKSTAGSGAKRLIWCENTGLADFAQKAGFDTILGSFCNASNSRSIQAYSKLLGASAIVPSLEISYNDISRLQVPQNIRLFYPLVLDELLMQSRQCLLHNLTGCTKHACGRNCIEQCTKQVTATGTAGEAFRAIKRQGFYSGLFSAKPVSYTKAFSLLKNKIDTWLVDLRFLDSDEEINARIKAAEDFAAKGADKAFSEPFKDIIEKKFWFC